MAAIRTYSAKTIACILGLALSAAVAAHFAGLPDAFARGIAIGGIGAAICCGTLILQVRQFARMPQKAISVITGWSLVRYLIYGIALYRGYTLDGTKGLGILGVVAGLFVMYAVIVVQAIVASRRAIKQP
jgi:hypothetical protein